jgi:hypothetical protein
MYFSADVETNGPAAGLFSMLSIGVTALHPETLQEVGHFYQKLRALPDAREDPSTMKWWDGFPDQYAEATRDPRDPRDVMRELEDWIVNMTVGFGQDRDSPPKPTFVAYPASFDFAYYCYYAWRFTDGAKFGFDACDMGSLAMGYNGRPYREQSKKSWPEEWVRPEDRVAIHQALEDARQQARIFRRQYRTICRPSLIIDELP